MERRVNTYRQLSPGRARVWTEKSPRYVQYRKVSVFYYLCSRNGLVDQPHFVEVKLCSPEGLYLRDFMNRLNELRGRGMASRYSWSCKRNFRTGFVWHDLSADDLIHPSRGSEYILKGSELIEEPNLEQIIPGKNIMHENLKQLPEPEPCTSRDGLSTSSSMNGKEQHRHLEDDSSSLEHHFSQSISHGYRVVKRPSPDGHLNLVNYKVAHNEQNVHASTQTEENSIPELPQEICSRYVSRENGSSTSILEPTPQNPIHQVNKNYVVSRTSESPTHGLVESSSDEKIESLGSLIKADAKKMKSFRSLEEKDISVSSDVRLKATNMITQIVSCGSISVKDHSLGIISNNKPRSSSSKFPSPLFSSSFLGELDYMSENPKNTGLKSEDKEDLNGSLTKAKVLEELGSSASFSSFDADRKTKLSNAGEEKTVVAGTWSKWIPLSIQTSLCIHPRSASTKPDRPRNSSESDRSHNSTPRFSIGNSKRIIGLLDKKAPKPPSSRSFREASKTT